MASLFQLVNQLAELAVGRRPRWQMQDSTGGVPTMATDGASMQSAVVNRLQISLRENLGFKTTRIDATADPAGGFTSYEITVDGSTLSEPASTSGDDLLGFLAAELNATSAVVTASVEGSLLVIRGNSTDDYAISVNAAEGDGTIEIAHEDASTADARIFRLPGGTSTDRPDWGVHESLENLDFRGAQIAVPVAGYRRCYVEIDNADGDVIVTHGPCVSE